MALSRMFEERRLLFSIKKFSWIFMATTIIVIILEFYVVLTSHFLLFLSCWASYKMQSQNTPTSIERTVAGQIHNIASGYSK